MHIIERLFDRKGSKKESHVIDMRDHVSMALQLKGLGSNTAILYGTLFENNENFLPIEIDGSTTISSDGVYVVPPYYRYYKLVTNAPTSTLKSYFYAVKEGAFLQLSSQQQSAGGDGEIDKIRKGNQLSLSLNNNLTDVVTTIGTISISSGIEVYLANISFSYCDHGGARVEIYKKVGATETLLYGYTLTGHHPNVVSPINFLDRIDEASNMQIIVRAYKLLYNYSTLLTGRVTIMTKV